MQLIGYWAVAPGADGGLSQGIFFSCDVDDMIRVVMRPSISSMKREANLFSSAKSPCCSLSQVPALYL
jgi:hypothetical protein